MHFFHNIINIFYFNIFLFFKVRGYKNIKCISINCKNTKINNTHFKIIA